MAIYGNVANLAPGDSLFDRNLFNRNCLLCRADGKSQFMQCLGFLFSWFIGKENKNQLYKNLNTALLETSYQLWSFVTHRTSCAHLSSSATRLWSCSLPPMYFALKKICGTLVFPVRSDSHSRTSAGNLLQCGGFLHYFSSYFNWFLKKVAKNRLEDLPINISIVISYFNKSIKKQHGN